MAEGIAVEHHLGLFVCAGHYVPNSPEGSSLDVEKEHKYILKYASWHLSMYSRSLLIPEL